MLHEPVPLASVQTRAAAPPAACDAGREGTVFWNTATRSLQVCNGTSWASYLSTADLPPQPIIWSGGCDSLGAAAGWNTYCLNTVEFATAASYFSVNPNGTVTFQTAGYYRVSYAGIALGAGAGHLRLSKNGAGIATSYLVPGTTWTPVSAEVVYPFAAGDTLLLEICNPGTYAFGPFSSPSYVGRFQIVYAGRL